MTSGGLLVVVRRRWYVIAVVLVCAGLATWFFMRDSGGFTSRTVVTLSQPYSHSMARDSFAHGEDVVAYAGLISTEINHGDPPQGYAMSDAPFYGAGLREAVLVSVPNFGGQWSTYYPIARLDIQVVGRNREWVAEQQRLALQEIKDLTDSYQTGADSNARITATVDQRTTQITEIHPTRTHQVAAGMAMMVASLIMGAWMAVLIDQIARARETDVAMETTA